MKGPEKSLRSLKWCFKESVCETQLLKLNCMVSAQVRPNLRIPSAALHLPSAGDHLLFFNPKTKDLSPDGYFAYQTPRALLQDLSVPQSFKRRMWALGSMRFITPLQIDLKYECLETVRFVKKIKSDYYVGVDRQILECESQLPAVTEFRTLVYTQSRPSSRSGVAPEMAFIPEHSVQLTFQDRDIVRYSALTNNPHRVHLDKLYCRDVEGYEDTIVQGPFVVHSLLKYMHFGLGLSIKAIRYKNTHFMHTGTTVQIYTHRVSIGQWEVEVRDKNREFVYCKASLSVNE
ncbi:LANO_0G16732g1_1 [Lachancea nothofagi CBS 11611]|uniref:LANO_0G16732g1_1 n=1 Tax=Lachancea nothofagi CBS 11611 TaxID=1266666 RepID=A0A1G4KKL5_9SACH|nr:LANO_0G16732g1_1 [Lachancea nothofagi CBS 11611]